ncbi:MAG: ExsB family transcriptional regulator [Parcubacteria group bacterium]|nr:ExsB family transcriptional regulator [Parcubacteria group bacterium]
MAIQEIMIGVLNTPGAFIRIKTREISETVGDGLAINALSGGVDSSAVTMLGHRALGNKLKTFFIENGLMRQDESQQVASLFEGLGIPIEIVDAQEEFFNALEGIIDPEEKREAVTQTFYKKVFGNLVEESGAKFLLQGTILTDVDETVAGIKRQHNVFEQLGIDPQKEFGYKIIEPLVQLRKDGVRKVAAALGLPESAYNRIPFPGPGLATRIIGEVTFEKVEIVRKATEIVEEALEFTNAFQYLAILHEDKVTGMKNNKRVFGQQIEVRCWESVDARTAQPTNLQQWVKQILVKEVIDAIPSVVSVTFNEAPKPPSTIEAI